MERINRVFWAIIAVGIVILTAPVGCENIFGGTGNCDVKAECRFCGDWVCVESLDNCIQAEWALIEYHGSRCGDSIWVCPQHIYKINEALKK